VLRTRSRWLAGVALVAVLVATAVTTASATSKVKKPSGAPWIVYNITDENASGGAPAEYTVGMKAAAAYVNNELGGMKGRPIQIDTCNPNVDPAATLACANTAVSANPILISGYSLLFGQNGQSVIEKAGIPMMMFPAQDQQLNSPLNFPLGGGIATAWPIMAKYLANVKKITRIATITYDLASVRAIIHNFLDPLQAKNVAINQTYFPVGTADFTSQAVAATSFNPDVIYVGAAGTDAVRIYKALQQAGWSASKIWNTGTALDKDLFFDQAGSAVDGSVYTTYFDSFDNLANPEVKLFRSKMEKYQHVDGESQNFQWGFSAIMTMLSASKQIKSLSPASLGSFLTNASNFPIFMGQNFIPKKHVDPSRIGIRAPLIRLVRWKNGQLVNMTKGFISFK